MKRIETLDDKDKQKAEVLAFYGRYDDAEAIYKKIDRKDLAVQMRVKIGDWFRVLQMIREGSGYDETLLKITDELGNFYAEKFKWDRAAEFYLLSKNYKGLIEAFTRMEDYENLSQIITEIPENDPLLIDLAERFQMVGMAEYAVKCYERAGQVKTAIDCCVLLNHWNIAVELAEKHRFTQIEGLLQQYAQDLLSKNRRLEAAELYRKANRNTEAAKLLSQIANDLIDRESKPIYIKKLYVMAALEVDLYKKRLIDASMTGQGNTTKVLNVLIQTLDSLITSDINTSSDKILNNPWRGAEAWHFFILCQKQLYAGQFRAALKTSLRLAEYELEIDAKKIYSLVALAAYYNKVKNWRYDRATNNVLEHSLNSKVWVHWRNVNASNKSQ
jgi:WD repeat-containing protein 35